MKQLVGLLLVVAFGAGCTNSNNAADKAGLREAARRFVPQDARNVVEAHNLPWIQLSFEVTRAPAEFGIGLDHLKAAQRDGWHLCEQATSAWNGFDDTRREPMRYVTERTYMLYTDGALLVMIGRHEHETEGAWKANRERGAATVQSVFITAHHATGQDARKQAAELGLQCG